MLPESEANKLRKEIRGLMLAVMDLREASHAAQLIMRGMIGKSPLDHWTKQLLVTAMVVSYMRPFTGQDLVAPCEHIPTEGDDANLHGCLEELRDSEYAHTDKSSSRRVTFGLMPERPADPAASRTFVEMRTYFPEDLLPAVVELCQRLSKEMETAAHAKEIELGDEPGGYF